MPDEPILAPEHATMLQQGSGIASGLLTQRGYVTFTRYDDLRERGFSRTQAEAVPGLGIPLWNVHGQQEGWQVRPDTPRMDGKGKLVKYETPRGSHVSLDVHPLVQPLLGDPTQPLWITEGVKKGDALASHGACAIALMGGVWGFRGTNAHGGKTILQEWQHIALNGREVYIVFDSDVTRKDAVAKALKTLGEFLISRKATPHIVALPDGPTKCGVDDFLAQGGTLTDLYALVVAALPGLTPPGDPPRPGLPTILQDRGNLPKVMKQVEFAVLQMTGAPVVFQRARRLVQVLAAEPTLKTIRRDDGTPIISTLNAAKLRRILTTAANFASLSRTGARTYADLPQPWVLEDLLEQEQWDFPPLTSIMSTPTLRPDGSLLDRPGYDAATGLYLNWDSIQFPAIPAQPSRDQASDAFQDLLEPFREFPLADPPCHRAAILAAVLSIIARHMVTNVPLFAIRSSTPGSGKSLLANAIAMLTTGRSAPFFPHVAEPEEERKRLLSVALDGDPLVVIDNVAGALGTPALDMALTSQIFKDRLLGKNQMKEAPLYAVFFATGNNMFFRGDMARRVVPIDIAPLVENPETRTGFEHPGEELLRWVKQERPRLIAAALTLLRAYLAAGQPKQQPLEQYGSFELWSDTIRSALVWAGSADPCGGRRDLQAISDEAFEAHATLLEAWATCYPHEPTLTLPLIIGDIQTRAAV
mgnify:CR=1 FL=1